MKIIESTYENIDLFKTKVQEVRNETVFNLDQSGIKGAQEIAKILREKKNMQRVINESTQWFDVKGRK